MLEKFYERLKNELTIRFPTDLLFILIILYFLYPKGEMAKLLVVHFQPDTIFQIKTGVLEINKILRSLCMAGSACVIGLRIISAGLEKIAHECNCFSRTAGYIASELDDLLCRLLPAFVTSVLLVLILAWPVNSIWSPTDTVVSVILVVTYVVMWVEHAARMSQYK